MPMIRTALIAGLLLLSSAALAGNFDGMAANTVSVQLSNASTSIANARKATSETALATDAAAAHKALLTIEDIVNGAKGDLGDATYTRLKAKIATLIGDDGFLDANGVQGDGGLAGFVAHLGEGASKAGSTPTTEDWKAFDAAFALLKTDLDAMYQQGQDDSEIDR